MSCLQLRAGLPLTGQKVASPSLSQSASHHRAPCPYYFPTKTFNRLKVFPRLVCSTARCQASHTCFLAGNEKNENGDEVSPLNAAEQPMEFSRKGSSVHDMLRKQMEERKSGGGGGSGRDRRSGGGGSGDGGGDGGDGRFSANLHELQQVFLATISFMLVYFYLIRREELTRLSSDYIKYLLGGKPSPRLRRTMDAWGRFFQRIKGKKAEELPDDELPSPRLRRTMDAWGRLFQRIKGKKTEDPSDDELPSPRLRRAMDAWGRFFQRIKGKKTENPSDDELPSSRLRRTMDAWGRLFQRIKGKKAEEPSDDELGSSPAW